MESIHQKNKTIEAYYTQAFIEKNKAQSSEATRISSYEDLQKLPSESVEILLLENMLNTTFDYHAVVKEGYRVLKPHGTVLCTAYSICLPIDSDKRYFGFTIASAKYIFGKYFKPELTEITHYGNALSGRLALRGTLSSEVEEEKLITADPFFPVIVGVKAMK
jgi:ubiquinone/menaquinone biosynthesis C-methylase UbiE